MNNDRIMTKAAVLAAVLATAAPALAGSVNLGAASDYTVLTLGGELSLTNPQSGITGNVGIGPGGTQHFSDGYITGNLVVDPTADNSKSNNVAIGGDTLLQDFDQVVADAIAASLAASSMTATDSYGDVKDAMTIFGTGGLKVIELDKIDFSGSDDVLTFSGTASDFFVINVYESIKLSHQESAILVDGVPESNVFFNMVGTGDVLRTSGNASLSGIFLTPEGSITLSPGRLTGSIIAGGDITLTSGATIYGVASVVPLPAPVLLGGAGLLGLAAGRRLKRRRLKRATSRTGSVTELA